MLDLAGIDSDDIFYDLGSGYAQNLLIAAQYCKIAKGRGFDIDPKRAAEARRRIEKAGLSQRIKVIPEYLEYSDQENATVVLYGLSPSNEMTTKFIKKLKPGARLIYYVNCPQPAILPDKMDYPFYVATAPLKEARSELQWLKAHVPANLSSVDEYWKDLLALSQKGKLYGFFGTDAVFGGILKRLLRLRLKLNRNS